MKRSAIILLNICYWICYFVLIMVILGALFGSRENADEQIARTFESIILFALFPSAITFYSFYFLLFPRILQKKSYWITGLLGLGICLVSGVIAYLALYMAFGNTCLSGSSEELNGTSDLISIILFIAFISFISGVIALVIQGFITWIKEIKLKDELKQKNHETELALVKSQLDPHFLFNTLNNIDVLILKDQEIASEYLNKLSDIMRFMLFETKADEIPLSKELEYIGKYIELQKIRTANIAYVNFEVFGDPNSHAIAPMLFIPFIENAFKHTANKKIENAIDIQFTINTDKIVMKCTNKLDMTSKHENEAGGLGNKLIQRRLDLLYPNNHELNVMTTTESYSVLLHISKKQKT